MTPGASNNRLELVLDLQVEDSDDEQPPPSDFERWVRSALTAAGYRQDCAELTVRLSSTDEIRQLNQQYRGKDKPTNVLSFPADLPDHIELPLLGDMIICGEVVRREAHEQAKALRDHWAHMVIHGTLHLLGFDHVDDTDAAEMEGLEITILKKLGIANPYIETTDDDNIATLQANSNTTEKTETPS